MEFAVHKLQTFKLAAHIIQGVIIFVTFCLMIAIFTTDASIDGRPGWFFGLSFLTFPALIFLTMSPRFPRTRKLANPYALAAIDGIYCILWLSGFSAVANWISADKCAKGCKLAGAEVALGVILWLSWCLTTAMSVYGLIYYRKNGYLPGASRAPNNAAMIDPDKEAFSIAPNDEYAPVNHHDAQDEEEGYGGPSEIPRYDAHSSPFQPASSLHDTSYTGAMGHEDTTYIGYSPDPTPEQHHDGRAQFPAGNY